MQEGLKYLYTRGSGLLISLYDLKNKNNKISLLNLFIELNKFKMSLGDSYLIYKKKYHHLYTKRYEISRDLSFNDLPNGQLIKQNYLDAIKWKIKPKEINNRNIIEEQIYPMLTIYLEYLLWYESKRQKKNFLSIEDYILQFNKEINSLIDILTKRLYFKNNLLYLLYQRHLLFLF